jgi:hypothetical protein
MRAAPLALAAAGWQPLSYGLQFEPREILVNGPPWATVVRERVGSSAG